MSGYKIIHNYPEEPDCNVVTVMRNPTGGYEIRFTHPIKPRTISSRVIEHVYETSQEALRDAEHFVAKNRAYGYTLKYAEKDIERLSEVPGRLKAQVQRGLNCLDEDG